MFNLTEYQHYDFKMIKELRTDSVKSTSKTDDSTNDSRFVNRSTFIKKMSHQ